MQNNSINTVENQEMASPVNGEHISIDQQTKEDFEFDFSTTEPGQSLQVAALNYAKAGLPVFLCKPDKTPKGGHGCKDATCDCGIVKRWWDRWPDALIGLRTGTASGVFVLDIDVKNGGEGFASLEALEEQYGPLPATLTVKTPSGGEHRYFMMPQTDPPLGLSTGKLGSGLDTRGENGHVVVPPSKGVNGKYYQFVNPGIELAELPQWVIELLRKPKKKDWQAITTDSLQKGNTPYGTEALNRIVAEMAGTPEGQRNSALNRLAFRVGNLVRDGEITKSDSLALFKAALSAGLPEDEVRKTFESGYSEGIKPLEAVSGTTNRPDTTKDHVFIQRAADMSMKPIHWLWPYWVPKGKLTVLAGTAGTGKTTLALLIAATISAGGTFPDGSTCEAGNVLIWSGEDVPEDTLIPRLKASGANLEKCYFVQGTVTDGVLQPFDPATDIQKLMEKVREIGNVSLLIIDPIVNAIHGDMNKANEVRRGLAPLVSFGEINDCTLLGITHFKKGSKGSLAQERVIGSQAFGALARMVLVAGQEQGKEKRVLARAKSNIAPDYGGFEYTLQQVSLNTENGPVEATYALWGDFIPGTADEILKGVEEEKEVSALDNAIIFLRDILCDGAMPQKEIESAGVNDGHSLSTIKRAKVKLQIKSRKTGLHGTWVWELPDESEL